MEMTKLVDAIVAAMGSEEFRFKALGEPQVLKVADLPDVSLMTLLQYGVGRWAQDRTNSTAFAQKKATGNDPTVAEKKDIFDHFITALKNGEVAASSVGAGDPVAIEAIRLACEEILRIAGVTSRAKALAHPAAGKYFTEGKSGGITPNAEAVRMFIAKHDDALRLTERAKAIVDAKSAPEARVEIEL